MDWSSIGTFFGRLFSFDPNSPLLFTQFYFWAFFALVYAVFALVGNRQLLRNGFLFLVSLLFYFKTSGLAVGILLFVTCSDFLIARRISRTEGKAGKKFWLICSICIDLLILCYFKYTYFFADFFHSITGMEVQVHDIFGADRIILPVGISFFIFQVISYTVDVYRGDVKPVTNILDFGFYVSFFPQLVAGPIVKASDFIPQLYKPFHLGRKQFGIAVFWIMNGLAKKIILSDYIAVNFIDRVFDNPLLYTGFENLCALFGYSLQVYADFSGYTDIAIGVAMLMGFYLPQNFNSPYKAPNPQDFWRRWHMSLSRWLKSYLYIPLGGNRNATFGTYFWIILFAIIAVILSGQWAVSLIFAGLAGLLGIVALLKPERKKKIIANINRFITMLLGGLWHGASWNFIIWGGLNGIGLIVYQFWKDMAWWLRMALSAFVLCILGFVKVTNPRPVWNLFFVWMATITFVTAVRFVYHNINPRAEGVNPKGLDHRGASQSWTAKLGNIWAVTQTFTFITFTRLFFRSGSNLDPAVANEVAWNTAKSMVAQIGSPWNVSIIPDVCIAYWKVFALVVAGLVIHLLPARFKRWYRINFALLPIPVIGLCVVVVVFLLYQFVTAGFQPFIYFQF